MEREGVIKFDLAFEQKPFPECLDLSQLIAWRTVLHRLGLIGQDPERYGGLGFGNISQKIEHSTKARQETGAFIISGTQTGADERLDESQFCIVTSASIRQNRIVAEGPVRPSSEALTHASVYGCDPEIRFVIHVHSPEIWRATRNLKIAATDKKIAYGTPDMADAVRMLVESGRSRGPGIFSMLGHEDGVVAYGDCADSAANLLVDTLARSLTLQENAE